jgi:hypothetical protein
MDIDDGLRHAPIGEVDDAVGHLPNGRVVGDDGSGCTELTVRLRKRFKHSDAGAAVEGASRFVAEQYIWPLSDGSGNGDPLLLSPRQLGGEMPIRSSRPTSISAASGVMGWRAISVTRATFSRAVSDGIRL